MIAASARRAGVAMIFAMARAAGARLVLASLAQTLLWAQAPVLLALAAPAWSAMLLGVLLAPVRARTQQSLRRVLRRESIDRIAQRALSRPSAGLSEAEADAAFWTAHLAEFAVSTTVPAIVATSVAMSVAFVIVARGAGLAPTLLVLALLAGAAIAVIIGMRAFAPRAARAVDARRMVAVWLAAALRGGAEIRGAAAHEACVGHVRAAVDAWCDADDAFEWRRDVFRAAVAVVALGLLALLAPSALRTISIASANSVSLAVALVTLLTAGATATRALSDAVVTVSELERIDVTIAPGEAAPPNPARLTERPSALVLRELELRYGEHRAFSEPDRRLPLDGMLLISGPNGAGKSTLAAAIAGVLSPAAGSIALVSDRGETPCAQVEREQLLFVPQEPVMVTGLSVRENIALLVPEAADESMRAALVRVGLDIALDRSMGALSRGQKHRVGIARALLAAPMVLVLDEPDAWLDTASRATLVRVLLEESALRAVVVISHRDDLRASASAHVVIDNGRIESVSRPAQRTA